jgi:DNA-binding MarR family transcriptional regulator/GNAT superfamily N-acetyltransferase
MEQAAVAQVRSFNRLVTERVGALEDHYLSTDRPLGEARVLWEVGEDGCDIRLLRSRLALDSGYLSRVLRSLESDGLVRVGPSEHDRRVRKARLTPAGRRERALLDGRAEELARSLLEPLNGGQRDRLVGAMREVERLLTAAVIEIQPADPDEPAARHCLHEYFAELNRRFDAGFDPKLSLGTDLEEYKPPAGVFLVARLRGQAVGCGALRFRDDGAAELKRMWVAEQARGLGVGRRLLSELERHAGEGGARLARLDTNRNLKEAISLYRSAGYREVEPYNDERYANHWFEKRIK